MRRDILLISIICFFVLVRALWAEDMLHRSLNDFDEARYAEIARNVVRTGEWVLPLAGGPDDPRSLSLYTLSNGEKLYPYFWKPPLHTIVIASIFSRFGVSEWGARLPSLISGFVCIGLVYMLSLQITKGSRLMSGIATAFFTSTSDFSFLVAQGNADMMFLAFALASIVALGMRGKCGMLISGAFLGLAFMTKSFATFWIVPVAYMYFVLIEKKTISWKMCLGYATGMLLVVAPWHVYMYIRFGSIFIERYVLVNLLGRATGTQQNIAPIYWYVMYLVRTHSLAILIAGIFGVFSLAQIAKRKYDALFLILWVVCVLIPFSLVRSKVWWYVFPLWVPMSLLVGYGLQISRTYVSNRIWKGIVVMSLICVVVITYRSWSMAGTRNFGTNAVRTLAVRNQGLAGLAVTGRAYESVLFYFGTGNVSNDWSSAQYVVSTADQLSTISKENIFNIVDREDDLLLWKRDRGE